MSNALAIYGQFDTLQRAALALQTSGYFSDTKTEAQAIVKVMAGAELGLPPFAAMTGIHIIQGKPVLGANVIATLVKNDPRYDYRIKKADNTVCVLEWYEGGTKVGEAGFTIDEAKAAGLTNKDNWKRYTSDMLFARAISRGARRFAPGIFGGSPVYTPDEMGADVDEEGYVIDGSVVINQNGHDDFDQTNPHDEDDFNQDTEQEAGNNGAGSLSDIRASLEKYKRMTGIQVADAVINAGLYDDRADVESVLQQHKKIKNLNVGADRAVALDWFDFLVQAV